MSYPIFALVLVAGLLVSGSCWWHSRRGQQQAIRALADEQERVKTLRESEERLREAGLLMERQLAAVVAALENIPTGVLQFDAQGRTVLHNRRLLHLLDLPESLMATQPTLAQITQYQYGKGHFGAELKFLEGPERELIRALVAGRTPTTDAAAGASHLRKTKEGSTLEVRTLTLQGGATLHSYSDVTQHALAQQGLREREERLTEELGRSKKVEQGQREARAAAESARDLAESASRAKLAFLANMAQDIRTPMNGMLGTIELLGGLPMSQQQQNYVATLRQTGRSLLTQLDDTLDLAMIESGKLELERRAFDPRALLQDCLDMWAGAASKKGLVLDLKYSSSVPARLQGDTKRVQKLLAALLGQVVECTASGAVTLSATPELALGPGGLRVCVSSTGHGMEQATLDQLFKPFAETPGGGAARSGSNGLGLATSRLVAQAMGGTVSAESEAGRVMRLCFTARLELATSSQQDAAPAASMYVPLSSQRVPGVAQWRILLVEDNPTNQFYTQAVLRKLGHKVDTASNGREGIGHATSGVKYDLILMDCEMPEVDGFEATRRIRQHESQAGAGRRTIIALSASAANDERKNCLDSGMDEVLAKPFTVNDMRGLLARVAQGEIGAS